MLMSNVTTLNIGGPAKDFKVAKSEKELIDFIKANQPFLVIGEGSNLLVSDQGVDKLVIKNEVSEIVQDGSVVTVKSGTILQNLVDFTISHGLSGLQNLTGIPGTVGGAIYGNAGAYGQTISDHLISVVILDPSVIRNEVKDLKTLSKDECNFGYRDSGFKKNGYIILEATFKLEPGKPEELKKVADEILAKRLLKYPKGIKCPGSFFKNLVVSELPQDILNKIKEKQVFGKIPAGALLEEVGAKGDKLRQIEIASYHANLFINRGGGRAEDFYNLAKKYAKKVKEKFGISLEPEVQLINLPPLN